MEGHDCEPRGFCTDRKRKTKGRVVFVSVARPTIIATVSHCVATEMGSDHERWKDLSIFSAFRVENTGTACSNKSWPFFRPKYAESSSERPDEGWR